MKNIHRFKALSFFLIAADLLAAGGGPVQESATSTKGLNHDANDDNSNDDSQDGNDARSGSSNGGSGDG